MKNEVRYETLGLLGGTFDPIHNGHIAIARDAVSHLSLSRGAAFLPCRVPVHRPRPHADVADAATHRVAMIDAALANCKDPSLSLNTREIDAASRGYTWETLTEERAAAPDTALIWLIGEDAFGGLTRWFKWKELFSLAHFAVFPRHGASDKNVVENAPAPPDTFAGRAGSHPLRGRQNASPTFTPVLRAVMEEREIKDPALFATAPAGMIYRMKTPIYPVSSTQIRAACAARDTQALRQLLPPSVLAYILEHHLYTKLIP